MMYANPLKSRVSFGLLLLTLGAGCGDDSNANDDVEASNGASDDSSGEGNAENDLDVCALVPASTAQGLLDSPVKAQDSAIPSSCDYSTGELGAPFVLMQAHIHDGVHIGGSRFDAKSYMETQRSGSGLPPDGKVLIEPMDLSELDGGFWRAYGYQQEATLESGGALEVWLRTGDDLLLVQRLISAKDLETPAQLADRLKALALALAAKL